MKTICMIIPYFGKWPEWFPLFLHSCRSNPTIDWLFFTDCPAPENNPKNTTFTTLSYANYQDLISKKLKICFTGDPYKLCDIKPALGSIHQEMLSQYDYFGFGDLDVVYGDLRKFITPKMLTKDLISTHPDRVSGHFCLLKNSDEIRNAFREISNWPKRFESREHSGIDESQFTKRFIKHRKHPEWIKKLSPRYRACSFKEQYSTPLNHKYPWIDGTPNYPELWHWENGMLTAGGHEMMYLHFMNWKSGRWHNRDGTPGTAPWEKLNHLVQINDPMPESFYVDFHKGFIRQP